MKRETRKRLMDRKIVEYLLENKSVRQIAKLLNVGDRRITKVSAQAENYGYLTKAVPLPPYPEAVFPDGPESRSVRTSEVDTFLLSKKDWIKDRLTAGWSPITVYEEIGAAIGRSSFYRFMHRHELSRINEKNRYRVVPEIVHRPGEALLLDWGKLRDVIDPVTKKKKTLWAFVGILGFSRYLMVRLVWSNSTKETCLAIESMLREIGGVPERVTSDNPKCFALEASLYEPLLNPVFERLAQHYGFRIECLPPGEPEKKGKVERPMPYIRRLYEAHGSEWHGIEESQAYINKKLTVANERKHGTTQQKPITELIEKEVQFLKPLPALAYSPEEVSEGIVRRDGHVRFAGKYYSCEESFIGKTVFIIASETQVSLYHNGKLIEIHGRIPASESSYSKSTKPQHLKPWEREMKDHSLYRKRAQALGGDVDRFILHILEQGQGFIDTRKIWGILSLDKTYDKIKINEACRQAINLGVFSYRMVKSLLKLMPVELKPTTAEIPKIETFPHKTESNKFARPMSVYEDQLKLQLH